MEEAGRGRIRPEKADERLMKPENRGCRRKMKTEDSGGGLRRDEEAGEVRIKTDDSGGGRRDGSGRKRTQESEKGFFKRFYGFFKKVVSG